ncbi:S-adenosyl-L-methionine-dependent methyltransferase [Dacryopinax primogenitus]|uniref:S-adenosyl-L-methionine-dependent methyltransferase n=1 Tax=Dacryopinax primogenitus (strain DJM 731) TaxID=1858805 RepID=M5G960_DACPD|nr:S-adenosyl-L-methionine-dependent methyltransferase [Dacryopinax primogenitus]EJU05289.1 S-adenosyl-L-methionine-dependent methyltransferase [Dacryopinax primogenitus]
MSRPEHIAPPEIYYGDAEARKYTENSRIQSIQSAMTLRALELLALPPDEPAFLLDIGCGSGLSGEILDEEGYNWVGVDIAPSMLAEVALEREVEGDLFLQDIGQGFGFRPGTFDGAISISVIQWLCNADVSFHSPPKRLQQFFSTLYASLVRGARAVLQFYPQSDDQVTMITSIAMRCGFEGGLVVDYPNSTKAKKYFLCLFAGSPVAAEGKKAKVELPMGLQGEGEKAIAYERRRGLEKRGRRKTDKKGVHDKEWILRKKELYRQRGKAEVPRDSKYTGRRRKFAF